MNIDINLIGNKTPISPKEKRLILIRKISFVILFLVGFFSILLFLINLRLSVNSVQREQQKVLQELSPYDEVSAKIFLLNGRVRDIAELVKNRKKYAEITASIIEESPSVTIAEMEALGEDISITASSSSLSSLNDFLNSFISLSSQKKLGNVSLKSLTIGEGGYLMTVTAKII